MYMTRMELDTSKRKTIMALASPGLFHGAIESAFNERGRNLWRIDKLKGKSYLLLVSDTKPDLTGAVEQFGIDGNCETRDYSVFLSQITEGRRYRFRLTANPVISKSAGPGARGEVLAHVTVSQQEKWLYDRAQKNGFSLMEGEYAVTQSQWVSFHKGKEHGRQVVFRAVTFEGVLTVTDKELFVNALMNGMGREKAYGCGLLTVVGG